MSELKYVWYASYGSNLNEERFLCYIHGGQPQGSMKVEPGCQDHSRPLESRRITIPYPLYFSGDSPRWGGGGAFIGHQKSEEHMTYGRMYLITTEQFIDVVSQENKGLEVNVDLQSVQESGCQSIIDSQYGTLLCLGMEKENPIFTFTSNDDIHDKEWSTPSEAYLGTIIAGLLSIYTFRKDELIEYLLDKPLVKPTWTRKSLGQLIESIQG